ncbi:MAG: energy-coupling factor transporter transmembrane protein EcfT [Chloroflexi bacterium]|nr:energy-coupling factor transporter transmembrane protein EcfT [Chloroflexota bacterium]
MTRLSVGPYRRLCPTTKLVIAFAEALIAIGVRGWTGPLAVACTVVVVAAYARVLRRALVIVTLTAPLVLSIVLVNTFFFPGAHDVLVRLGPLTATTTGVTAAAQAVLRVAAFALSVSLFSLTTQADDLLADLERRGLGRRGHFVIGAALSTIPRMRERIAEVTEAQRARGLDTESSRLRRVAGIVPLVGPVIFNSLTEVEERTMALEARGFSAPTRRIQLKSFPETPLERTLAWSIVVGTVVLLILSIAGLLAGLP